MASSGISRICVIAATFCAALFSVGWAVASTVHSAFAPLVRLAEWALLTAFPYPAHDGGTKLSIGEVVDFGRVRAAAYEKRRLERAVERDMSSGCGLRLAA